MVAYPKHPSRLPAEQLLVQCDVRFSRRSGPGGQNRNKVETAAILTHRPTGITAEANERRSQNQNREVALFRLRLKLAIEIRSSTEIDAYPSELWRSRLRGTKIAVSPTHSDFPALLAEALDVSDRLGFDVSAAAGVLGCSMTQLVNLIRAEPRAFTLLNARREAAGLRTLV